MLLMLVVVFDYDSWNCCVNEFVCHERLCFYVSIVVYSSRTSENDSR